MTMSPALQSLLARLPPGDTLDFSKLIDAIYAVRFTGPLTVDFLNGAPKQISLGQPVKLAICAGGNGQTAPPALDKTLKGQAE